MKLLTIKNGDYLNLDHVIIIRIEKGIYYDVIALTNLNTITRHVLGSFDTLEKAEKFIKKLPNSLSWN